MMKTLRSLNLPSFEDFHTYRTLLMGLAAIWVLSAHIPFNIPIYRFVISYGDIGVDMFFLVSGFGLFYSLQKTSSVLNFYKKRFFRIIPTYITILVFFAVLQKIPFTTFLWQISCVSYFVDKPYFDWYIPSSLLLYALSPLYNSIVDSRHSLLKGSILLSVFIVIGFADSLSVESSDLYKYLFISRIPVFIMGLILGQYCQQKYSKEKLLVISLSCVGLSIIIRYLLHICDAQDVFSYFFINSFLAIPACYCIIYVASFTPKIITGFLNYCGQRSLEIYLVHVGLIRTPYFEPLLHGANKIIIIALTFALAHILHSFILYISKKMSACYK